MNPYGNRPKSTAGGDLFSGLEIVCFQKLTLSMGQVYLVSPLLLTGGSFDDYSLGQITKEGH